MNVMSLHLAPPTSSYDREQSPEQGQEGAGGTLPFGGRLGAVECRGGSGKQPGRGKLPTTSLPASQFREAIFVAKRGAKSQET